MIGGLFTLGTAGVIYLKRKTIIKRCEKDSRFAAVFASVGCLVIVLAARIFLAQN